MMTLSPLQRTGFAGWGGMCLVMLQACTPAHSKVIDDPARKRAAILKEHPGEQAQPAEAFVDSVGVATHLAYDNTPYYTHWPEVLKKLESLGVGHIRDGYYDWPASSPFLAEHRTLAGIGIKTTYVVPLDPKTTPHLIQKFAFSVHDMEALESSNECDAGPNCGGGGTVGVKNMVAFLPTIYDAGQLIHVPVLGPSFTIASSFQEAGNLGSSMDYNTLHIYFGGRHPGSQGWGEGNAAGHRYGSLKWWMDQGNVDAPGRPFIVTETGYITKASPTPYTVPETIAATYIPRTLLLAFNNGIRRTFIYELLDEFTSDPYGLLRSDLSEKPAFLAVKNLLSLLSDSGPGFTADKLNYTITGADGALQHTLLQKRDHSFWLVLWLERSGYDPKTNTPLRVNPSQVGLHLDGTAKANEIVQFDEHGRIARTTLTETGSTLPLTITENIAMVHIQSSEASLKGR